MVKLLYNSTPGKILTPFFANKYISKTYGLMQNSMVTQLKVPKFVKNFAIDLKDYEPGSRQVSNQTMSYKNFNEFFIRKFVEGKRPFQSDLDKMPACAEARYYGYESVDEDTVVPVKGKYLNEEKILRNPELAKDFKGGPLMIARLCPVDYHRYHYVDNGKTLANYHIKGEYHSVNPLALKFKSDIFMANERRVSIIETENFGKLAYVEVGAVCVGKIVQTHSEDKPFKRGDEKGYFLFGGSTVILMGEKGRWKPSDDIIKNTKEGRETYVHLGDEIGLKL
ncbi:MAG: phosphatidylserine decarboxylase [Bacteriovoracaceae bacterium]|nr:phosphatidylserine decarboxylase [Bacteriovoracaceae bacterium]